MAEEGPTWICVGTKTESTKLANALRFIRIAVAENIKSCYTECMYIYTCIYMRDLTYVLKHLGLTTQT